MIKQFCFGVQFTLYLRSIMATKISRDTIFPAVCPLSCLLLTMFTVNLIQYTGGGGGGGGYFSNLD